MPLLLQSSPGSVVKMLDPVTQCVTQLYGMADADQITYEAQVSIVTRLTLSMNVNAQFLHTLGGLIYIYSFGDKVGSATLSGLAFPCACPDDGILGAEQMILWYSANRASQRQQPMLISIGTGVVLTAFVVSFTEDVVDPSTSLVQWTVNMVLLPDINMSGPATPVPTDPDTEEPETPLILPGVNTLPPGDALV